MGSLAVCSSLCTAPCCWVVVEEQGRRPREAQGVSKRVTWSSLVQVRSISPRRPSQVVGGGPSVGRAQTPAPSVGPYCTSRAGILDSTLDEEKMEKTLGTLRRLSKSTKALVGQVQ